MSWNIEEGPDALDKYDWKAKSSEEDQVLTDTTAPGDINILPGDWDQAPTLAPATTGIHSGLWSWDYTNIPDSSWYVQGSSVED